MTDSQKEEIKREAIAASDRAWEFIFDDIRCLMRDEPLIVEFCYSMGAFTLSLTDDDQPYGLDEKYVYQERGISDINIARITAIHHDISWVLDMVGFPSPTQIRRTDL